MTDFDFDELDKAVNSVIGQAPSDSSTPSESTNTQDDTKVRNTTPSFALHSRAMASHRVTHAEETPPQTQAPEAAQVVNEEPPVETASISTTSQDVAAAPADRQSYLPKRRAGRFMDVVHPSSDMRSSSKPYVPRREGVSMQPISSSPAIDPSFTYTTETPEPLSVNETVETSDSSDQETQPSKPVDNNPGDTLPVNPSLEAAINDLLVSEGHAPVVAHDTSPEPASVAEQPVVSIPQPSLEANPPKDNSQDENPDELSMDEIFSDTAPQTSPFIEGAKVDKRPLGGNSTPVVKEHEANEVDSEPAEADDPWLDRPGLDKDAPLPEELNQDLMSIESVETTEEPDESPSPVPLTETPQPVAIEQQTSAQSDPVDSAVKEAPYSGPTSIAQQYKLEPREDKDDETGDIFDTKTYHQPIKSDEPKSSPLPWIIGVIAVVLLIVVGLVFAWWSGMLVVPM